MQNKECDCEAVHQELINKIKPVMPPVETILNLSELFKIMGDKTRMQLLWALDCNKMCVCDLAFLLNMTKSAVSHQLKALKLANLVKSEKEGRHVFYSLSDSHVKTIFEKALEHVKEGL